MDEIHSRRLGVRDRASEAPTQELRPASPSPPRRPNPFDRYPQV